MRAERLPAALIQGQRDFFGAHTYHRVDKDGTFHTEWSGDRSETVRSARPSSRRCCRQEAEKATRHLGMTRVGPQILTRLGGRPLRARASRRRRLRNRLAAGGFAERAGRNGLVPDGGVAVFFAIGPENCYQFEQWRRPLERWPSGGRVFVIVDRPDTGDLVLRSSALPVAFARGSGALEELVERADVRVVLYLNQVEPNFRMLRFAEPGAHPARARRERQGRQRLQPAQGVRPDFRRRRRGA